MIYPIDFKDYVFPSKPAVGQPHGEGWPTEDYLRAVKLAASARTAAAFMFGPQMLSASL